MDRLEALADALMKLNGWSDPSSQAYRNRNPLLLRAFSLSRAQAQDENGVRVFTSLLGGYRAALNDLYHKASGRSRAKLGPDDPLEDLLRLYGSEHADARRKAALFLQRALGDDTVHVRTPLGWFLANGECAAAAERSRAGELHSSAIPRREEAWRNSNG